MDWPIREAGEIELHPNNITTRAIFLYVDLGNHFIQSF
jgi:hypothetical protein